MNKTKTDNPWNNPALIKARVGPDSGLTPEEEAKMPAEFRQIMVERHAAGTLNAEMVQAIEAGGIMELCLPESEIGRVMVELERENELRPIEHFSPHETTLAITFSFRGGPWTHQERYEREGEVIRHLEGIKGKRPLHAVIQKNDEIGVAFTAAQYAALPADAIVCVYKHVGDGPLTCEGWIRREEIATYKERGEVTAADKGSPS